MTKQQRATAVGIQRQMLQAMTTFNIALNVPVKPVKSVKPQGKPPFRDPDPPTEDPACAAIWQMYQESLASAAAWLALYGQVPCGQ